MLSAPGFTVLLLVGLVGSEACAIIGTSSHPPAQQVKNEDRSVLTDAEIARSGARTAYEAIRRLRPEYFAFVRRSDSNDELVVYVDGIRIGTTEVLHAISSVSIREVRRFDTREATTRFGTGHSAGAIVMLTKSGR